MEDKDWREKKNQNRWSLEICRLELLKIDVKNIFVLLKIDETFARILIESKLKK